MAGVKRADLGRKKKKNGNGIEKGPSRGGKGKAEDKFKDAKELAKFNRERQKRFGAK